MRVWMTRTVSFLFALCFPWVSAASGGMVLCLGPDGRVGFGPGSGLVCTGSAGLVEAEYPAATPCAECRTADGCAHVPGKGLLHRPSSEVAQRRLPSGHALPYALALAAHADSSTPAAPVLPPSHVLDGQHGMRLRLAALTTVVLRL
jgi:hypothetical protein